MTEATRNYLICDRCGNLETVFNFLPDTRCSACGSRALWAFAKRDNALAQAAMIRERKRDVEAGHSVRIDP